MWLIRIVRPSLALACTLLGLLGSILASPAGADSGPAKPDLRRGVNLTSWFQYSGSHQFSPQDLRTVHDAGIDYVRIPIDPAFMGWKANSTENSDATAKIVTTASYLASLVTAQKLALIIDIHPEEEMMEQIERDETAASAFVTLWSQIAAGLTATSSGNVALEILNEPHYYTGDAERWPRLAARIVAAIRASLPNHLIIVGGRFSNGIDGLAELKPLADPNILYTFHFYDPFILTHQSASWWHDRTDTAIGFMNNVPYPASSGALSQIQLAPGGNKLIAMKEITAYALSGWNGDKLGAEIDEAATWARRNNVRLICTEFGAIRTTSDQASRLRWIADMRQALETRGIGWAIWDLDDTFGIATRQSGNLTIAPEMRRALGLQTSDQTSTGQP